MDISETKRTVLEACPERLHPLLGGLYRTAFPDAESGGPPAAARLDQYDAIPASLSPTDIEETTLLPDREALMAAMPTGGTAAEFGVKRGEFAEQMFAITAPETFYLVDTWEDEGTIQAVRRRFRDHSDAVRLRNEDSVSVLRNLDDDTFDWVYINSTHEYEHTLAELRECQQKVKDTGYIAGDDYYVLNGVIPAVHQFCAETDWQLEYLTMETHGRRSYALCNPSA